MKKERIDVLLVAGEDGEQNLSSTRRLLDEAVTVDCSAEVVRGYAEGVSKVLLGVHDVCLVSYRLGSESGLDFLRAVVQEGCRTPVILLTSRGDRAVDMEAMEAGAADYLVKEEMDALALDRSIRYALQRRRSETRIREQAALLDEAHDSICAYDLDHNLTFWNKGAERMTGWTAEDMMPSSDTAGEGKDGGPPPDQCLYGADNKKLAQARKAVLENGEWSGEMRQHTKSGKEIIVQSRWSLVRGPDGEPQSILVINTDITERKKLESQFLRSQRMESIGRLVGGIAHDLGNLLVPVLLGTEVLLQRHGESTRDRRTLEMMQKSAQRGSDMIKQILAFARGVDSERAAMSLETVIHEVERIIEETFPEGVEVKTTIAGDLWQVHGDATQLQQIMMNLCVNARDALGGSGGDLTIEAENVRLAADDVPQALEAKPGAYVCLSVADTGPGIPEDELDKIFEPFFTTKPDGEGTGLGLSTVYSILKSHGGFVDVESTVGEGATFCVYIPKAADQAESEAAPTQRREARDERILLVDDETAVLEMSKDSLEQAGYQVTTAASGDAALRALGQRPPDVVITDIAMPEMNGMEVIRTVRERAPDVCIIAMSGLSDSEAEEAMQKGADYFLAKPFDTEKLHAALGVALSRRQQAV